MSARDPNDITGLLHAWTEGESAALDRLIPLIYGELRCRAKRYMAHEKPGHALQSGDLVNEVYLHLLRLNVVAWRDRTHFFATCAQLMRRILIDAARSQLSKKRGGDFHHVSLVDDIAAPGGQDDLLALDQALRDLAEIDPRKSKIVELRIFGGLSVKETAQFLHISEDTVTRDCIFAKHWLLRQLQGQHDQ